VIRRLVLSSLSQQRLEWAWRSLESLKDAQAVLVVGPTRTAADDFVRGFCPTGVGRLGLHRFSPFQLAATFAGDRIAQEELAPLSRLGLEAVAAQSVHAMRKQLVYFAPVADTPGFARAVASTLSELRLAGLALSALERSGSAGVDLARMLLEYERRLEEGRLADFATILRLAADAAESGDHRLSRLPVLLLDAPPRTTLEQRFIKALTEKAPAVLATALEGDEAVPELEKLLRTKAKHLEAGDPATSLDRVRRYVFASETLASATLDSTLEFFSAAGEGLECVEIARRIRLLAAGGVPFDRVAILLRNPDDYLSLVEDALKRASMAAWFTRGTLRPDPAGRAFLALLDCAAESLSASRFAEYLSLGQVPTIARTPEWVPSDDELLAIGKDGSVEAPSIPEPPETDDSAIIAGTLQAPLGWENLLIDAAVIGGRDRWARRLRGLEAEYKLQLEESTEGDALYHHLNRQLRRLGNLETFALPLIEELGALPDQATWGEWLAALSSLAGHALREPESVLGVLTELAPMSEVGPVGLAEIHAVLSERLRFLRREPEGNRYGAVFVGSIPEASGRSFDYVFLPGVAEGAFPRKSPEDPLLLDEYRGPLHGNLTTRDQRFSAERQLLRTAASAAQVRLLVSYPRTDAIQGRTRVPSFYALEVLRAAEGRFPDVQELERRAAEASPSRLGWPAPVNPAEAIDDAEHDLALLDPMLHRPAQEVRGRGKYLLVSNAHLARSLRTRWKRWHAGWTEADGIVDPDAQTLAALAEHRLRSRSYSASSLQHFAACPYRFLLYAIFSLRVREEPAYLEQLDPLTRGGLFHEVQREFFREMQRKGLLPVHPGNLDQALAVADQVLDRVATQREDDLAPAIPRIWKSEIETVRTDLRAWIRQLIPIHAVWTPVHFEYSCGMALDASHDPASTRNPAIIFDGIKVRGSIDLVEENTGAGVLRVTDHKTGKAPPAAPLAVGKGEVLQPVLYALAAEQLLGKPVRSGLLFYCTQRGNYEQVEIDVNERSRAYLKSVLDTIDTSIDQGFLPAAPRAEACDYCDYRPVCGPYEQIRTGFKSKERLEELQQRRMLP
jgi:ATP-dependent helicase/nuclease subunit B